MVQNENDYEPIIYEQPIKSDFYQNHDYFLLHYFDRPMSNNKILDNTEEELTAEELTENSSTKHIYQNISKERQSPKELDLRKLVDKLEQAEITMKLEETANLKLQYVNNIQTTTSQINNIHDFDTELSE